jgi:cytochrome P450
VPSILPTSPKRHWLYGHSLAYARDPLDFLVRVTREHGDVARLRLGGLDCYLLAHPGHIEFVLRSDHKNFIKDKVRLGLTRPMLPLLGNWLLLTQGDFLRQQPEFWRQQRKQAQPVFQIEHVRSHGDMIVEQAVCMARSWEDGVATNIERDLTYLTARVAVKALVGGDLDSPEDVIDALNILVSDCLIPQKWVRIRKFLPLPSKGRSRRVLRRFDNTIYGLIHQRRSSATESNDMLSRLLKENAIKSNISDQQVRNELVTLLMAGHETTALGIAFTFYLLASNPDASERLSQELMDVCSDRLPTIEDVAQLQYTEWAVLEALRLYPPAWIIGREALVDCEIGQFHVPSGTQLLLSQWVVHRDARWFEEPERFKPERWGNELNKRLPRCAYFPFGDGPQVCVGQYFAILQSVLVVATVLQLFRLSLSSHRPLELDPSVALRTKHGIWLTVHRR